jgi:integrase
LKCGIITFDVLNKIIDARQTGEILSKDSCDNLLVFASTTRHPLRDRLIVLLSVKAGLRAAEIANLTWEMVLTPAADIGPAIELHDCAAKKSGGRLIPIHPDLGEALRDLRGQVVAADPVIRSQRGRPMSPVSIVNWFAKAYRAIGLQGCSSHSGRRTFITRAARLVHNAGASLRDVQLMAGHRSIQTTQRYIDGDTDAQRKLVSLI